MLIIMPAKSPTIFPAEQRMLVAFGERLRLARKRRKLSSAAIAERARVSRTTLYNAEAGDGAVTMGTYLRIMAALGLEKDFEHLASDDTLGRNLQDLAMLPQPDLKARNIRSASSAIPKGEPR